MLYPAQLNAMSAAPTSAARLGSAVRTFNVVPDTSRKGVGGLFARLEAGRVPVDAPADAREAVPAHRVQNQSLDTTLRSGEVSCCREGEAGRQGSIPLASLSYLAGTAAAAVYEYPAASQGKAGEACLPRKARMRTKASLAQRKSRNPRAPSQLTAQACERL